MKHYNVIIIGAGASGCMCALTTKNKSVAIIDCGKSLAKKIMVTGNGRCNLTNMEASSSGRKLGSQPRKARFDSRSRHQFH